MLPVSRSVSRTLHGCSATGRAARQPLLKSKRTPAGPSWVGTGAGGGNGGFSGGLASALAAPPDAAGAAGAPGAGAPGAGAAGCGAAAGAWTAGAGGAVAGTAPTMAGAVGAA